MECANGLDITDLPSFNYFKVRKHFINKKDPSLNQIILTFIDVSHKIYAESKANRKAQMLLMNTSIAQEMAILLNSLQSQCKILMTMFQHYKLNLNMINLSLPSDLCSRVLEIQQEVQVSIHNMHSSMGNLLNYLSDILHYA